MWVTDSIPGKVLVAFFICLEAYTMPSNAMKTSTQGGFISGILDPVSSVHDGFNSMDLPSTSGVVPSTISK